MFDELRTYLFKDDDNQAICCKKVHKLFVKCEEIRDQKEKRWRLNKKTGEWDSN